jgi:serine/threonine protein kinase
VTKEPVAIKIETLQQHSIKILKHEATILNYLFKNKCDNIPLVYWFGKYENMTSLIMPYYNVTLEKYAKILYEKSITLSNSHETLKYIENKYELLLNKCLNILSSIHNAYVVHRDIKPQNFMIKNDNIVLIDFGMSTFFVDENKNHILPSNTKKTNIMGTSRYISVNVHNGEEYTRRDDIISLGYTFLYLYTRSLPWDELKSQYVSHDYEITSISHPYNQYLQREKQWIKLEKSIDQMHRTPFINRIKQYFKESYNLGFSELPDYYI